MSDKQLVLDCVRKLPEDASLDAISEEVEILAALRRGAASSAAGKTKSHDEVKQLLAAWNAK